MADPNPDIETAPSSRAIVAWGSGSTLTLEWERGEGDARLRGWVRASDDYRAIETNGDPIWEDDDRFSGVWESHSLLSSEES